METLIAAAREAREQAYAPYSGFRVGAALLCEDGSIFKGCNIENSSFGATNCAERTAIFAAIANGKRKFKALAVYAQTDEPIMPCGICRQVLAELAPNLTLILLGNNSRVDITIKELIPQAFSQRFLK